MTAGMVMASVATAETVGWVFHVMLVSGQAWVTCRTSWIRPAVTFVRQSVSVAEFTVEPAGIDDTSNATKSRRSLAGWDFTLMSALMP